MVRIASKVLWTCELLLLAVAVLAIGGMLLLTSADAISRYLLNSPILGAYEITEKYLMVAAMFLGLSYACRGGILIRVTFLVDRLPPSVRPAAEGLAWVACLGFSTLLLYATAQQALRALADTTTLTTVPVPVGPAYALVPMGFLAMTVLLLVELKGVVRGSASLFRQDAPTS